MSTDYGQERILAIKFKVNKEEKALLEKLAKPFKDLSKYLRYVALKEEDKTTLSYEDKAEILEELRATRKELSRVGGNLNQIARSFNQSGRANFKSINDVHADLQFQFQDLMEVQKEIEKKIVV